MHKSNNKKILTLDLGTQTGWAMNIDGVYSCGVKDFSTKRFEGGGMRYLNFRKWLDNVNQNRDIQEIYFEEVLGHTGTAPAHVYGGFLGILSSWCEDYSIPYEGVPVKTIKKFITGSGNAKKEAVIEAVCKKGYEVTDHNEADAMALMLYVEDKEDKG